jgi:hypothetical protein
VQVEEHFASLRRSISSCGVVAAYEITEDARTLHEGFFKARLEFTDGSVLSFREYVNTQTEPPIRHSYSYHYYKHDKIVFRYDNTPHHPNISSFPHHKHLPNNRVVPSEPPSLQSVLGEIVSVLRSPQ